MEALKTLHDAMLHLGSLAAVLFWATSPKPARGWSRWAHVSTAVLVGGALLARLVQGCLWLADSLRT